MHLRRLFLAVVVLTGLVVMSHSLAFAQGTPFFAVLLGGNEVAQPNPPSGPFLANQGDLNGFGSATVIIDGASTVCFGITVNNIDTPTAAHIHAGRVGLNGSIVVTLTAPSSGDPGASSGCVTGLDPALLSRIRNNPSLFYINVHTGAFPGGALRGNLF